MGESNTGINATEYVSYNDNHLGVFMTTAPFYDNQPWGSSVTDLKADHSDDSEGMHFGSTPSVPTMADGLAHTVKIRYTRGFTTEKAGTGQITTTNVASTDRRKLVGSSTKFKTELRTGFEFGYGGRVKANVKVKINRDKTLDSARQAVVSTAGPVATAGFADDGEATRVISITSDTEAQLENTGTATSPDRQSFFDIQQPAFDPKQDSNINYNIIKEFPGEIQVSSTTWTATSSKSPWKTETWRRFWTRTATPTSVSPRPRAARASQRLATKPPRCTKPWTSSAGATARRRDASRTSPTPPSSTLKSIRRLDGIALFHINIVSIQ